MTVNRTVAWLATLPMLACGSVGAVSPEETVERSDAASPSEVDVVPVFPDIGKDEIPEVKELSHPGDWHQDDGTWTPAPCQSHEDCGDGYCVELVPGSGQYFCAPSCMEECPLDWTCKSIYLDGPDPVSMCLPPVEVLCRVCKADSDCLLAGALCVLAGGPVGYCGKLCSPDDAGCPAGFSCRPANGNPAAPDVYQCLPEPGTCCQMGSWTDCDDGNECTLETCSPSLGCGHAPTAGGCSGPDACQEYFCSGGQCLGVPVEEDLHQDGLDEDCDGLTDEDVLLGLELNGTGFGSGSGESKGGGFWLSGRLCSPPYHGPSSGGGFLLVPGTSGGSKP